MLSACCFPAKAYCCLLLGVLSPVQMLSALVCDV